MTEIQVTPTLTQNDFTERQFDVLCLLGGGMSNDEIATELRISPHTAKFHVTDVMRILRVSNRTSAVVEALRLGVVALNDLPSAAVKEFANA